MSNARARSAEYGTRAERSRPNSPASRSWVTLRTSAAEAVESSSQPSAGKARKAQLIHHFGSFEAVRAATLDELSALPGFNRKLAEAIKEALSSQAEAQAAE